MIRAAKVVGVESVGHRASSEGVGFGFLRFKVGVVSNPLKVAPKRMGRRVGATPEILREAHEE